MTKAQAARKARAKLDFIATQVIALAVIALMFATDIIQIVEK